MSEENDYHEIAKLITNIEDRNLKKILIKMFNKIWKYENPIDENVMEVPNDNELKTLIIREIEEDSRYVKIIDKESGKFICIIEENQLQFLFGEHVKDQYFEFFYYLEEVEVEIEVKNMNIISNQEEEW